LRALRKRKPQEAQALALASSQSWLPLLRPSIPIGWRLRLFGENFTQRTKRKRLRLNGNRALDQSGAVQIGSALIVFGDSGLSVRLKVVITAG